MTTDLAARIKKIREDAGDNPNEASKKVGISRNGYIKWEQGDTENMKLKNLMTFCDRYHVDIVSLLTGREESSKPVRISEPNVRYGTSPETVLVADAYDRLSPAKRMDVRLALTRALLESKAENPLFDTGDLGQLLEISR